MSLYSGMDILVKAQAFDQVTKIPVSSAVCTVNFFKPPKNPDDNPSDRIVDYSTQGVYDPDQQLYVAPMSTDGWIGGLWYYQIVLTAPPFSSWSYFTFTLKA
jgi:hypothetical protein